MIVVHEWEGTLSICFFFTFNLVMYPAHCNLGQNSLGKCDALICLCDNE